MKNVTVYFRDVKAEEQFQEAMNRYNEQLHSVPKVASIPKQPARICHSFMPVQAYASTVDDVREMVVGKLKAHPISSDPEFVLKAENVWVFQQAEEGKLERVFASLDDGSVAGLVEGATYYAMEVFDIVPTDLFRTVDMDHLKPTIFCLPEKRNYTELSPFMTAAMDTDRDEYQYPWHCWDVNDARQQPKIHGISVFAENAESLFCGENDLPISDEKWDPFVTVMERQGDYKFPLEKYEDLVNDREATDERQEPHYGILITDVSHTRPHRVKEKPQKKWPHVSRKVLREEKATHQAAHFCFALGKGTNLRDLGMTLVYDNLGAYHCSLVRTAEKPTTCQLLISSNKRICYDGDFMENPESGHYRSIADEKLIEMLTPNQESQPEMLELQRIGQLDYYVFPYLVARFQLHSLVLKAMAEPMPLDQFEDGNTEIMFKIASFLFSVAIPGVEGVYDAIRMLEHVGYVVDNLHGSFRDLLVKAIHQVENDYMTSEERDLLYEGVGILNRHKVDDT